MKQRHSMYTLHVMTTVQYMPCIKVLNLVDIEYPVKLAISKRGGHSLWWKYAPCIPTIVMDPRTSVSVLNEVFMDRFSAYLFSQTFFNIYMYNKLSFDDPLKFYVDEDHYSFYYFLSEGEVITIPLLRQHPLLVVMLTRFDDRPVIKICVRPNT
jgi:hypothetical protein